MTITLTKTLPRHAQPLDRGAALDVPSLIINIDHWGSRLPFWVNDDDTVPPLVPSVVLTGEPERDLIQCRQCGCSWSEHCADHCHGTKLVVLNDLMPGMFPGLVAATECDCAGMVA